MRRFGPAITSPVCSSKFPGLNVSVNDSPSNGLNAPVRWPYTDSQLTPAI